LETDSLPAALLSLPLSNQHVLERRPAPGGFVNLDALSDIGFGSDQLSRTILATYHLLDRIDETLAADGVEPLCQVVELANLSSMIGNILGAEMAKCSNGMYRRNEPHRFPDLLPNHPEATTGGIEIKMALGRNQPKGHLAKPGHYITCRYVLTDKNGNKIEEKADRPKAFKPVIWEIRTGFLKEEHFNISNTDGDSGKTAVVNAEGMFNLKVVYVDLAMVPGNQRGRNWEAFKALVIYHMRNESEGR
jgi:hypothetical protein